jgi:hypothetical protein
MRIKILAVALLGLIAVSPALARGASGGTVTVRGYVKSNGTVVAPHIQTGPDSTRANNWSTKPNINPITGKEGTKPVVPASP